MGVGCSDDDNNGDQVAAINGLIAFTSDRDGQREIYVMNPDGTEQRNITHHPAQERSPVWSPDGTRLLFATLRGGNAEIYSMK
jgi:TolB protein